MPVSSKEQVFNNMKNNIHTTVAKNRERIDVLHKKIEKLSKRPPQKFFYHKVEKKDLRQTILTESVKVLVTTLVAILVTRVVKKGVSEK